MLSSKQDVIYPSKAPRALWNRGQKVCESKNREKDSEVLSPGLGPVVVMISQQLQLPAQLLLSLVNHRSGRDSKDTLHSDIYLTMVDSEREEGFVFTCVRTGEPIRIQ